jgi:hypothetical protein
MKVTDVPLALLRFQYQVARLPLHLIETRFVARMDSEAPARLFYERSLGMLDAAVGTALSASNLRRNGARRIERSDALRRAARLDAAAAENVKQADAELDATLDKAMQDKQDAFRQETSDLAEAREAAQARKQAAVKDAEQQISAGREEADHVAAERKKAVETAKSRDEAKIDAAEQAVVSDAADKLGDAQAERGEAAAKRAEADHVEELEDLEGSETGK